MLETIKNLEIDHLVYASSSSVYGSNSLKPFNEDHSADHSLNLYAATKKANELMAHSYSHLFNIPMTGLRFFTVYGPWGRPDMALFIFCRAISNDLPIDIYNHGKMQRGFTYIDDVVQGVIKVLENQQLQIMISRLIILHFLQVMRLLEFSILEIQIQKI